MSIRSPRPGVTSSPSSWVVCASTCLTLPPTLKALPTHSPLHCLFLIAPLLTVSPLDTSSLPLWTSTALFSEVIYSVSLQYEFLPMSYLFGAVLLHEIIFSSWLMKSRVRKTPQYPQLCWLIFSIAKSLYSTKQTLDHKNLTSIFKIV